MRRSHLVRLGLFVAVGFGALTACSNGEAVSATRVSVAASPSTSTEPTTSTSATTSTPPPVPAAAPKPAAPVTASSNGTPVPPAASSAAQANPAAEPVRLTVTTNPKLGKIVTDNQGHTVYRLDADPVKPPKSTCVDDCAKRFPPVLLPTGGVLRVDGIDPALIGRLTRADNTVQLTLAGHPLYRYAGDAAPGDTLGQGITGGAAISPTGGKAAR